MLQIDDWFIEKKYDFISALNLLDRCDKPLELLNQIKLSLKPDGRFLLALVLPFSPFVESGILIISFYYIFRFVSIVALFFFCEGSPDHVPKEELRIRGKSFEEQVWSIIEDIFIPAGFGVVSWSRVPYLCEGDLAQSYYWLDDVVFVLKVT